MIKKLLLLVLLCLAAQLDCSALSLNIDTEYRLRGLAYMNLDFNTATNGDAVAYYNQRFRTALYGKFPTSKTGSEIELFMRLQAVGIVGSSQAVTGIAASTAAVVGSSLTPASQFSWMNDMPYPNRLFIPFIENAYIKYTNFEGNPVDIIFGKQPLEYGTGFILSDNEAGFNALRFIIRYPKNFRTELFTAKLTDNFVKNSDNDLNGLVVSTALKGRLFKKLGIEGPNFDFGYFTFQDYSGTLYKKYNGTLGVPSIQATKSISRQFYDFRLHNEEQDKYFYTFEYVYEKGGVEDTASNITTLNSKAYYFSGGLMSQQSKEKKYIAKASVLGSMGSGFVSDANASNYSIINNDIIPNNLDETFYSPYSRRFDGMDLAGGGSILRASNSGSLLNIINNNFTGLGYINLGVEYSPMYAWTIYIDAFMYNASRVLVRDFRDSPPSASYEQIFLGQFYNIGSELNLAFKYSVTKNAEFRLSWARYTPPTYIKIWPTNSADELYFFETVCMF